MEKRRKKIPFSQRLDNAIGVFFPRVAFRRRQYRMANDILAVRGGYEGAARDRLLGSWTPSGASADEVLLDELSDLRERSRYLVRNDGVAAGALNTMADNVVGTGILPQARIDKKSLGMSYEEAEDFQRIVERAWEKWEPFADRLGRMNFCEIQDLVMRQILMNGDVIVLVQMLDRPYRPYSLCLNVIEADRLATPSDKTGDKSIRKGVEIDEAGEPVAYWICKYHPGDTTYRRSTRGSDEFIRIPARNQYGRLNVLHLYHTKRPGQSRGEPFFAPVISRFKHLCDYMDAELVAAKVAACFAVFIKRENSEEFAISGTDEVQSDGKRLTELEPGMVENLEPGESIDSFSPQRPGAQFDAFVEKTLRFIGAGLGMPYELIFKDFSKTNYSSARASLLEARKMFRKEQKFIAEKLCQLIYENLIDEVVLRGEVSVKDYFPRRMDYTRARWIAPGWGYIDPTKEISAAKDAIKGNISTLADECAAHGKDWEEVIEQRAREEDKRKRLGLPDENSSKQDQAPAAQPVQEKPERIPGQEGIPDDQED